MAADGKLTVYANEVDALVDVLSDEAIGADVEAYRTGRAYLDGKRDGLVFALALLLNSTTDEVVEDIRECTIARILSR